MQTLTRNPLADPGILGVNSGASFAIVLGAAFGKSELVFKIAAYVLFVTMFVEMMISFHKSERIPVEKGGRKVLIPVDDIRFIMAKDDYSCIYTVDDRFLSTTSLAQFEAKLCDFGFFRVHRRYIVNLACVTDVETVPSGAIQLGITGVDERVPVSRRRVVPLKKALSL